MRLNQLAGIILNTAGSLAVRTTIGVGKVEKYYPILIQIVDTECDEQVKYYLDDVRAWADGDIAGVSGKEQLIIQTLAQAALSHLARIEARHERPPPEARRIENRDDDD